MAYDAGGRIDREADDLLRCVVRNVLDIDAAFGGDHERHFAGFAVDQDREIELPVDVGAFLDVEPVDLLAVRSGLHRDQGRAQHLPGEFIDLGDRFCDAHAALVAGAGLLELALAAAAGVDLALHPPDRAGKRLRRDVGIGGPQHRHAARDRHAEFMQQRLGLVFVNIHEMAPESRLTTMQPGLERDQRPSRSGAIFLQASTRPCTAPTDLSNASRSLPVSSISTMRSTPFDPITAGTPTYISFTLYSPLR